MNIKKLNLVIGILFSSICIAQNDPCTAINMTSLFGSGSAPCSGGGNVSTAVTPSGIVNGFTTNGAGITGLSSSCVAGTINGTSQDYWYQFTAPSNMGSTIITISPVGGGLANPEYQLYTATGVCPNLSMTLISCGTSTGTFTPISGSVYYMRIYGEAGTIPAMDKFSICPRTTPTNDLCTNAIALTSGTSVCSSDLGAVLNGASSTGSCATDQDVWFKFTTGNPANCYSWQETQINTPIGCPDNSLAIYSGCNVTGTGIGFIGYNFTGNSFNDMSTLDLSTALLPNTTYYIQVASNQNQTFCLKYNANTPISANDVCSTPASINSIPLVTDNAVSGCEYSYVASQDANITAANICAGTLENVSWFHFVASSTGSPITISFANISCNNGGGGFQTGLFTGANCTALTATGSCISGSSGTVNYTIPAATVVAGNNYSIAMDGNAGSNCHFSVFGSNLDPLPIELLNFKVLKSSLTEVSLVWNTATEKNNDFFTLERSEDGVLFYPIGNIDGAGNSSATVRYDFDDFSPLIGTSYYRLKQTDFDGNESYSSTLSNVIYEFDDFHVKIFPNPSKENTATYIEFFTKNKGELTFEIYDIKGIKISSDIIQVQSEKTTIQLNNSMNKGVYFIKSINTFGEEIVKKLMIN